MSSDRLTGADVLSVTPLGYTALRDNPELAAAQVASLVLNRIDDLRDGQIAHGGAEAAKHAQAQQSGRTLRLLAAGSYAAGNLLIRADRPKAARAFTAAGHVLTGYGIVHRLNNR